MTYDCFTYNGEEDILEIRLNILDPYVDYFVLGESTKTFSGKYKPLYYKENKERFKKWNHKIIHKICPLIETKDAFEQAYYQKENLVIGMGHFHNEDILYLGDIDEIWTPQEIDEKVYKLKQLNYCYFLNNRSSEQWIGTIVGKWGSIKEKGFNWNRANPSQYKENGGWHLTNMNGVNSIIKKLESYDHQEMNTEEIKAKVKERMENGEDYVGRRVDWQGKPFEFWTSEVDLPKYILDNKDKYKHLFK